MSEIFKVQKVYRNPPSLDGVKLILEDGREEVLTGTVWCSESYSSDFPPNKKLDDTPDGNNLIVTLNQGNPNVPEVAISLNEEQVIEIGRYIGKGSLSVKKSPV